MNRIAAVVCMVVFALFLRSPASAQYGQIGGAGTVAKAINGNRDVVGSSQGKPAAWLWQRGMVALPPFKTTAPEGIANSINSFGDAVGSVSNGINPIVQKACLWQQQDTGYASVQLIDDPTGSPALSSQALAINDLGWIVGSAFVSPTVSHAFVWMPEMRVLDITPNAAEAYAVSINNRNVAVGFFRNASSSNFTPFLWSHTEGLQILPLNNNLSGMPSQINDAGLIAGTVMTGGQVPVNRACVWRSDRKLQVYPGASGTSRLLAINQEGMMAGTQDGDTRSLLLYFDSVSNTFTNPLPAPAAPYNNSAAQIVALAPRSAFYNAATQQQNGAAIYRMPADAFGLYPFVPNERSRAHPLDGIVLVITPRETTVLGGAAFPAEIRFIDGLTGDPISFVGDVVIRLSASLSGAVTMPRTVTIPDGSTSIPFTITTLFGARGYDVNVLATPPRGIDVGAASERIMTVHIVYAPTTISGQVLSGGNRMVLTSFQFRSSTGQIFDRSAVLDAAGHFSFNDIPRGVYTIWAKKRKWLANTILCNASGDPVSDATISLFYAGDATGDNIIDIRDLLLLIAHYNYMGPGGGYLDAADFNEDNANDISDLLILINNYNLHGAR